MFYEARTHELHPVATAREAAEIIKGGRTMGYEAISYKDGDFEFMIVPDGAPGVASPFEEVAFLRKKKDGEWEQVESITAAWIKSAEMLEKYFQEAEKSTFHLKGGKVIIGQAQGTETAWFSCGCCGRGFNGNVKEQLERDQDAGFGICDECKKYH